MTSPSYTLITAAHNEARFLPGAIAAVLAQGTRPALWIIVSDGSTDETDRIAAEAAEAHDFIRFLRFEDRKPSPYPMGGISWLKVSALRAGLARFGPVTSDFVGNIDADVTFAPDFFARLMAEMAAEPAIGIGGGFIYNTDGRKEWPYVASPETVGGPLQFFRRDAWEAIGGYFPWGNEDAIAQIMVRMKGFRVKGFADLKVLHHKTAQAKGRNPLKGQFHAGRLERGMGFHPLHVSARWASRLPKTPLQSSARLFGYGWAALRGTRSQLPPEVVAFNRQEQVANLKRRILGARGQG